MIDFIVNETERIFCKAIKNFSKKDNLEPHQVSFLMSLKDFEAETIVKYEVCHNDIPVRETDIKEVVGVKHFDFKGYTIIVPPKIREILEQFSVKLKSKNVEIAVYLSDEDEDKVRYFLYDNTQFVQEFLLEDVLRVESEIT